MQVTENKLCTGCRMCEKICPVQAIHMVENEEGFIYPEIDNNKCIKCNLCKRKCPQNEDEMKKNKDQIIMAVKNKESIEAKKSTSAGVSHVIAKEAIKKGYVVFGCVMDKELNVYQKQIDKIEDLDLIRGSKYVFSDTKDTFLQAKQLLEEDKKVLYIGTPCQISGLKACLGKNYDNCITIDIVCHGVPSLKLFKTYIKNLEKKFNSRIIKYEFRNKDKVEWGRFCSKVCTNEKDYYINADFDPYYYNFLKGTTYRESCYNCKYANFERQADITLADFWGIEKVDKTFFDKNGVSLVIVNSIKGKKCLKEIEEYVEIKNYSKEDASKKNGNLLKPTERPSIRDFIYEEIDDSNYIKNKLKVNKNIKTILKLIIPQFMWKFYKKIF